MSRIVRAVSAEDVSGASGIDPLPDGRSGAGLYAIEQATAASKAAFWDVASASDRWAEGDRDFEGEFAMTEDHAQELKTQALAQQSRCSGAIGHEENPSPCFSWLD